MSVLCDTQSFWFEVSGAERMKIICLGIIHTQKETW